MESMATPTKSWRTRDAAEDLSGRSMNPSGSIMPLAASFDVDTCLARLRRDKAGVVRDAFGAAAQAVLIAVKKKEEDSEEKGTAATSASESLPALVKQWQELQHLRADSITLANNISDKRMAKAMTTGSGRTSARSTSPKAAPALMPTSAASSDSRITVSRAVLCTAASIAFDLLTPAYEGHDLDVVDVPQNNKKNTTAQGSQPPIVNMGAVLLQAQTLGQRVATLAENSTRRSRKRYEFRRDNAKYAKSPRSVFQQLPNPFAFTKPLTDVDDTNDVDEEPMSFPPRPFSKGIGITEEWKSLCLPRFRAVLDKGSGHAVYCDVEWSTRHGRIANLLEQLADKTMGPHLIVTTRPEEEAFAQEFDRMDNRVRLVQSSSSSDGLRVMKYQGSKMHRRKLRKHFISATGLPDSPFHVVVVSYSDFLKDYLHLCQLPYQAVILDDGWSWLAAAHIDANSSIGTLWDKGIFSSCDQYTGLAGSMQKEWDFMDDNLSQEQVKKACIGLTARHRILTTSEVYAGACDSRHQGPVPGLIKFLLPHFPDVVREEWDRSRVEMHAPSINHMRILAARSIVVYYPKEQQKDLCQLALDGLNGLLPSADRTHVPNVPHVIDDETFVFDGKITQSRRSALACFGPEPWSWLRYELGTASLQDIQDAMRHSGAHGYVCEEIVTASSLTSSGATGTVCGTMAYRPAVRCGRSFGSEIGLRQHMAAMHAPPGTWLCRTCGVDCGTSPARTPHERTCGQTLAGADDPDAHPAGAVTSDGKGPAGSRHMGPVSVVGKKAKKKKSGSAASNVGPDVKDPDGSFSLPGYRGVWVNPSGKHFVKIDGERLRIGDANDSDVWLFDSLDEAAKKHDEIVRERGSEKNDGLNFNEDGSRIVHDDGTPAATTGRGLEVMSGGASSVVPALSVINIKDLPKDVTPLLRDPRQTSRTGGNSKRHVYAYRGVCRQARKGHDRWQSQISFSGTNHYLGTFDSEWDAAAIYAWAHLILYGEEATRKARLEGEEAAAAYEREKKDIAAGKVIPPPPKPTKKKRKKKETKTGGGEEGDATESVDGTTPEAKKAKKKRAPKEGKDSPGSMPESDPLLTKAAIDVPILAPRKTYETMSDSEMLQSASARLVAARSIRSSPEEVNRQLPIHLDLRPCAPMASVLANTPTGGALLMGLPPLLFGWNVDTFLSTQYFDSVQTLEVATAALKNEYGINRYNDSFRTVVQGTVCVIGRASTRMERAWNRLGLGDIPLGGTIGDVDCNIGGLADTCSETAATIAFCPSGGSAFQFYANNDTDIVTLNGKRIKACTGSFPLFNEDVCTVGARVFVFLLPAGS